jgi:hypothetical protein
LNFITELNNYFSQQVTAFHGRSTPEPGFLAGYAFIITIIEESGPKVPLKIKDMSVCNFSGYRIFEDIV